MNADELDKVEFRVQRSMGRLGGQTSASRRPLEFIHSVTRMGKMPMLRCHGTVGKRSTGLLPVQCIPNGTHVGQREALVLSGLKARTHLTFRYTQRRGIRK